MTRERVTTTTEPDQLPITLEEVKTHLKETEDHQDELLRNYLESALDWAREHTRRAIVRRDYLITRDAFPTREWELPLGHVASIVSVKYIDNNGILQTWNSSPLPYTADLDTDFSPRLRPALNQSWPTTGDFMSAAQVTVSAGWTQADIPFTVRAAILLKVAELEQARAPGDPEGDAIASAATSMLTNWTLPIWA
jgi:uncharacterized phiE125 gp8 family phage protein